MFYLKMLRFFKIYGYCVCHIVSILVFLCIFPGLLWVQLSILVHLIAWKDLSPRRPNSAHRCKSKNTWAGRQLAYSIHARNKIDFIGNQRKATIEAISIRLRVRALFGRVAATTAQQRDNSISPRTMGRRQ